MKITDRKVLITGAGSGIGRELALRFGSAGGALALVGRRVDALEDAAAQVRARGGTAYVVAADLADRAAPDAVVAAAIACLGGLDVLINRPKPRSSSRRALPCASHRLHRSSRAVTSTCAASCRPKR